MHEGACCSSCFPDFAPGVTDLSHLKHLKQKVTSSGIEQADSWSDDLAENLMMCNLLAQKLENSSKN